MNDGAMRKPGGHCDYDLKRGLNGEIPDEYGKPAQYQPFSPGKMPVTPIQRRLQALLTSGSRPPTWPFQTQVLVKECGSLR
jgi:hypothetical protein